MAAGSAFQEKYPAFRPSIVAIASRVGRAPDLPEIFGTGFIVREDGLIMTCKHVVDHIPRLPRYKGAPAGQWPAVVIHLHLIPNKGMAIVPLEIVGYATVRIEGMRIYLGTEIPDVSLIRVNTIGLPALSIQGGPYIEGSTIFLAGFPMGTRTLRAPGWAHQFTPTLQHGIISAVLPFPCDNPHALLLECITEGGASGSPVFSEATGDVMGIVYAGIPELYGVKIGTGTFRYPVPTAHTLAVPGHLLRDVVAGIDSNEEFKRHDLSSAPTLSQVIADAEAQGRLIERVPKGLDPGLEKIPESEIEYPGER